MAESRRASGLQPCGLRAGEPPVESLVGVEIRNVQSLLAQQAMTLVYDTCIQGVHRVEAIAMVVVR